MEMTHEAFASNVAWLRTQGSRVGLRTDVRIDEARPRSWRFWRRRTIDTNRMVVYVKRARRDQSAVFADIRQMIVRYGGHDLSAVDRLTRATALRRLTERGPLC